MVGYARYVASQMTEIAASKNPFAEILRRIAELRPPPVVSTGQKAASVTLSTQNCRAMCAMTVPDWTEFPTRRPFLISPERVMALWNRQPA